MNSIYISIKSQSNMHNFSKLLKFSGPLEWKVFLLRVFLEDRVADAILTHANKRYTVLQRCLRFVQILRNIFGRSTVRSKFMRKI